MKLKKSLGQNLLIDKNIIEKIVSNVQNINSYNVFEIGPGTGSLTNELINKRPKSLVLVEKDKKFAGDLKNKFNKKKNIKVYNDDILDLDIESLIKPNSVVFGNLPYNISSQILMKFLKFSKWPPNFKKIIFMFQKEVGDKILANHKSKNYGRISIIRNWRMDVTNSFFVSKNCFYPKPKVDSVILVLKPKEIKKITIKNMENLEKITQILFSRKRKMINKAFKLIFSDYIKAAKELKIDLNIRPNQLTFNDFYKITQLFENQN